MEIWIAIFGILYLAGFSMFVIVSDGYKIKKAESQAQFWAAHAITVYERLGEQHRLDMQEQAKILLARNSREATAKPVEPLSDEKREEIHKAMALPESALR